MSAALVDRLASNRVLLDWLPVAVLPPVFVLDAALQTEGPAITPVGVLAAVVGCLPVVLRRRLRFVALAPLLTAGIVLILWQLEPGTTVALIPMIALFELARTGSRRRTLWVGPAVVPCVAVAVLPFADDSADFASIFIRNVALCWLALAAGEIFRHERAERERVAHRRVDAERLRIAREVHDVVAHTMVAINVQAGVAAHLLDRDLPQAHAALRDIKRTSGEALEDLRATLGVLRDDGEQPAVAPAAGLSGLGDLAATLRAAGVRVTLEVEEDLGAPAPVQAAGYRIVQEALTNTLRHAQAENARVEVRRDGTDLRIEVVDDGAGAAAPAVSAGSGSGLRGMRERAAALGGSVESGPAGDAGWRVRARLPLGASGAA